MENQELMNEEVVEATEETTNGSKAGKVGLVAAIVGGCILAGGFIYKKAIKPLVDKAKAKKAEKQKVEDDDAWKDELHEMATENID